MQGCRNCSQINRVFGERSVNERTVQHWLQKFRRGDENLEDDESRGRHCAVDDKQLLTIIEIDTMHQKLQYLRPALVNRKNPIVLHHNARSHISQLTL